MPLPQREEPRPSSRTVWISDVHLGTKHCKAAALVSFLERTPCETLYLVGDIVDGWQLEKRFYWDRSHGEVVKTILQLARDGTRVVYVLGNHDEALRSFAPMTIDGIEVVRTAEHETADGRRLLVLHGDQFDQVVRNHRWVAHLGDSAYQFALWLNHWLNLGRRLFGFPYWSLSSFLKERVKDAVAYVGRFEEAVARMARLRGMDGVVCGHIHKAELRDIDGVLYANDGDWVASCSALVEAQDGSLHLRFEPQALQPDRWAHGEQAEEAAPVPEAVAG